MSGSDLFTARSIQLRKDFTGFQSERRETLCIDIFHPRKANRCPALNVNASSIKATRISFIILYYVMFSSEPNLAHCYNAHLSQS
jgi:hypothetical protein